jgi:uncharacterized paraquat-inducible protein A
MKYPLGIYPIPTGSSLRHVPRNLCGEEMGISKWDHWNGFLVECPRCGRLHAKSWGLRVPLIAAAVLNVFSFFFTMRPKQAMSAIVGFLFVDAILVMIADRYASDDDPTVFLACMSIVVMAPVVTNAIVLLAHQNALGTRPGGGRRKQEDRLS